MEIIEGNKLIAEFIELKQNYKQVTNDTRIYYDIEPVLGYSYISAEADFRFHSSWDWLMPAVKKWNDLVISKRNANQAGWTKWAYKTVMLRTSIEPVFNDLTASLQWYNTLSSESTQK